MVLQERVLEVLKKEPSRVFTYDDIAEILDISRRQAGTTVQRMKKWGDILVHSHAGSRTTVRYIGME